MTRRVYLNRSDATFVRYVLSEIAFGRRVDGRKRRAAGIVAHISRSLKQPWKVETIMSKKKKAPKKVAGTYDHQCLVLAGTVG